MQQLHSASTVTTYNYENEMQNIKNKTCFKIQVVNFIRN